MVESAKNHLKQIQVEHMGYIMPSGFEKNNVITVFSRSKSTTRGPACMDLLSKSVSNDTTPCSGIKKHSNPNVTANFSSSFDSFFSGGSILFWHFIGKVYGFMINFDTSTRLKLLHSPSAVLTVIVASLLCPTNHSTKKHISEHFPGHEKKTSRTEF